jgi:hypothetical protein
MVIYCYDVKTHSAQVLTMKSEQITINGENFTINECSMRQILPLLESKPQSLALEIAKLSVFNNQGQALGDCVLDFGFSEFQNLIAAVSRVHGIDTPEKKD